MRLYTHRALVLSLLVASCISIVRTVQAQDTTDSDSLYSLASLPRALPRKHTPKPTRAAMSVEDLKTRLYIIADDSMLGRMAGTLGNVKATDYIAAEIKRLGLQPAGDNGTFFQTVGGGNTFPMRNVIAILRGSDPTLRNQYVALGAHSDHLGGGGPVDHDSLRVHRHYNPTVSDWPKVNAEIAKLRKINPPRLDSISNGADDDGSGTVTVLEIAEALAALPVKPKRSILFVWHTAEESGLLGSTWFIRHPTVQLDSIVAQLNMDMIGRGGASDLMGGNPRYLELVGSRCLSRELDSVITLVNQRSTYKLQFVYTHDVYTRSDQFNYAKAGIPIAFFFTGFHSDYHQVTDEPQYIDYEHLLHVGTLIKDVTLAIANLDHRLLIDNPRFKDSQACPNGW